MTGIHIFAFLVGCAPNLLLCDQIPTRDMGWTSMPECRSELPGLIRRHERQGYPVVMAKCHYVVDRSEGQGFRSATRLPGGYVSF